MAVAIHLTHRQVDCKPTTCKVLGYATLSATLAFFGTQTIIQAQNIKNATIEGPDPVTGFYGGIFVDGIAAVAGLAALYFGFQKCRKARANEHQLLLN